MIGEDRGISVSNILKPNGNLVNLTHLYSKIRQNRNRNVKNRDERKLPPLINNIGNVIEHINIESGVKLIYNGKPVNHFKPELSKIDPTKLVLTKAKFKEMWLN